jgi:hypothetical protein
MDPDPGGPKICGSCGHESQTLNFHYCISKAKKATSRERKQATLKLSLAGVHMIKHKIDMKKEENSILRSGGKVPQEGLI